MVQAVTTELVSHQSSSLLRLRVAVFLNRAVFGSLVGLMVLTAVPYGTAEPWWKAVFVCLIFIIAIAAIVEGLLAGSWATGGRTVLLPMAALTVYSLLQTITIRQTSAAGIDSFWSAISADPFQTRFFAMQLAAFTVAAALFYRYARSHSRIAVLVYVILGIAVLSAVFGVLRQTTQSEVGFGLPLIKPGEGFGQFINKNHFAFLMEMAFGLALGLIVSGKVSKERALIYFSALFPIWTALVLANSRGGLLSMLSQLAIAVLLFPVVVSRSRRAEPRIIRTVRPFRS
jgi:hypothetical protein